MKHIKEYEELDNWTKDLYDLSTKFVASWNPFLERAFEGGHAVMDRFKEALVELGYSPDFGPEKDDDPTHKEQPFSLDGEVDPLEVRGKFKMIVLNKYEDFLTILINQSYEKKDWRGKLKAAVRSFKISWNPERGFFRHGNHYTKDEEGRTIQLGQ